MEPVDLSVKRPKKQQKNDESIDTNQLNAALGCLLSGLNQQLSTEQIDQINYQQLNEQLNNQIKQNTQQKQAKEQNNNLVKKQK